MTRGKMCKFKLIEQKHLNRKVFPLSVKKFYAVTGCPPQKQ